MRRGIGTLGKLMESKEASATADSVSAPSAGVGVSFSIVKRSQSKLKEKPGSRARPSGGRNAGEGSAKDFIFSLEEGNIHSSNPVPKKKEYVIPLIRKVNWRTEGEGGGGSGEEKKRERKDVFDREPIKTEEELALEKAAAEAILSDVKKAGLEKDEAAGDGGQVIPLLLQNKPPVTRDSEEMGELADIGLRPEPSTAEDYDEMPIAEFGKAMLRGMGWKDGTGIGKNKQGMVAPIEYIPQLGRLGLGATPKPPDKPSKKRPGEREKKAVQGPYIGADGRVKHTRLIGEDIPQQPIEGYRPGNYARVMSGPHVGLTGKIVLADEESSRVSLRLTINSQVLEFNQHHLELISKGEHSKPQAVKSSTQKKEYGLIKRKGGSNEEVEEEPCSSRCLPGRLPETSSNRERNSFSFEKKRKRREDKEKEEEEEERYSDRRKSKRSRHAKESKSDSRSKSRRDDSRSGGDSREVSGTEREGRGGKGGGEERGEVGGGEGDSRGGESSSWSERLWVAPNLRVRIVDTTFKRGKYYNNKVEILDVVSGDECICRTNDGLHLEGVCQSMLETVVPKTESAAVMIVRGRKHKGQVGRLLERDARNYRATVELVHSSDVLTVDYDDICEFTGDVED